MSIPEPVGGFSLLPLYRRGVATPESPPPLEAPFGQDDRLRQYANGCPIAPFAGLLVVALMCPGSRAPRPTMRSLLQDIRFALRTLRRRRSFTLVAISTVVIGIGSATFPCTASWMVSSFGRWPSNNPTVWSRCGRQSLNGARGDSRAHVGSQHTLATRVR